MAVRPPSSPTSWSKITRRVEVGTLAPLDIVQAQAEAATRRRTCRRRSRRADGGIRLSFASGTTSDVAADDRPVDLPSPCRRRPMSRARVPGARRAHRHHQPARVSPPATSHQVLQGPSMPALT
jgi:hypothetical protein